MSTKNVLIPFVGCWRSFDLKSRKEGCPLHLPIAPDSTTALPRKIKIAQIQNQPKSKIRTPRDGGGGGIIGLVILLSSRSSMKPTQPIVLLPLLLSLLARAKAASPTLTTLSDLPFNDDDRLTSHIFAYPAGKCASLIDAETTIRDGDLDHKFVALDGEAYTAVFGHLDENDTDASKDDEHINSFRDCVAVCIERGTLRSVVARPLPYRYWNYGHKIDEEKDIEMRSIASFLNSDSCGKVEYGFVNYHTNPLKVYWVDARAGEKHFNHELGIGVLHSP